MGQFISTQNSGFVIEFANGACISVQWGPSFACERHLPPYVHPAIPGPTEHDTWDSPDAEVCIFDTRGNPVSSGAPYYDGSSTMPRCTPDQVAEMIAWTAAQTTDDDAATAEEE